jgi:hypothetical protein
VRIASMRATLPGGQSRREDHSTPARITESSEMTSPMIQPWTSCEAMIAAMATEIPTIPAVAMIRMTKDSTAKRLPRAGIIVPGCAAPPPERDGELAPEGAPVPAVPDAGGGAEEPGARSSPEELPDFDPRGMEQRCPPPGPRQTPRSAAYSGLGGQAACPKLAWRAMSRAWAMYHSLVVGPRPQRSLALDESPGREMNSSASA